MATNESIDYTLLVVAAAFIVELSEHLVRGNANIGNKVVPVVTL